MSGQPIQSSEEAIDLYPYWVAVKKRWRSITLFFIITVAITTAITFLMPKVYRVNAIISLGRIGEKDRIGQVANLADIQQIISSGNFTKKIVSSLKMNSDTDIKNITNNLTMESKPDSENVVIKYETAKPDQGIKIIQQVIDEITQKYNHRVNIHQKSKEAEIEKLAETLKTTAFNAEKIDLEISDANNEIQKLTKIFQVNLAVKTNEKASVSEQINRLKERIKTTTVTHDKLVEMSAVLENKMKEPAPEKTKDPGQDQKEKALSSIILSNNQQQQNINLLNVNYDRIKEYEVQINEWQDQTDKLSTKLITLEEQLKGITIESDFSINTAKAKIQNLKLQKEKALPIEIGKINDEIALMRAQKEMIEGIQVIAPPDYLNIPIKPQKRVIVMGAGGLAILIGLFLSLFLEWLQENRNLESAKSANKLSPFSIASQSSKEVI
jgi:hypothetical protein